MEQFLSYIRDAWAIDWVQALVVIVLSIVLAKLSDIVLCRILKLIAARTKSDVDDRVISILHRPIFISVLLVGLYYAGVVVLATGSQPAGSGYQRVLPGVERLPGVDSANVFSVEDVMNRSAQPGDRVLLLDDTGTWRGVGTAWHLAERGRQMGSAGFSLQRRWTLSEKCDSLVRLGSHCHCSAELQERYRRDARHSNRRIVPIHPVDVVCRIPEHTLWILDLQCRILLR